MRSNGSVSWKQASNTLSTTSSASSLLMFLTHNMDFTALVLTHSWQKKKTKATVSKNTLQAVVIIKRPSFMLLKNIILIRNLPADELSI